MALVTFKPSLMGFPGLIDSVLPSVYNKTSPNFSPATNIYEEGNSYFLELNVPGRKKEEFKISVESDLLTISYERLDQPVNDERKTIRREFSFPSFKRSFSLDENIDIENISAQYENGILNLSLPKKEAVKTVKQIAIS